jgi:hypothetical protein
LAERFSSLIFQGFENTTLEGWGNGYFKIDPIEFYPDLSLFLFTGIHMDDVYKM